MTEILWPIVSLAAAAFAWNGVCRWLARGSTEFTALKAEYDAAIREWADKFDRLEKRVSVTDASIKSINQRADPLGRAYSTRSTT